MKKWEVHAKVTVTAWGYLTVIADTQEEAEAKAMAPTAEADENDNEWGSKLWNDGRWTEDIKWEAAADLEITDTFLAKEAECSTP